MRKDFLFVWYKKEKYGNNIERHNLISIETKVDDIGVNAKTAMNLFCNQFGNLKNNEIVCIQELDANGNAVGEPIVPINGSNMVPLKH